MYFFRAWEEFRENQRRQARVVEIESELGGQIEGKRSGNPETEKENWRTQQEYCLKQQDNSKFKFASRGKWAKSDRKRRANEESRWLI